MKHAFAVSALVLASVSGLNTVRFDRESTGERVQAERVLTDLLVSYEFVPGTVFHAGYGSLYERGIDQIGARVPDDGRTKYLAVNRGLFFKASYLRRF